MCCGAFDNFKFRTDTPLRIKDDKTHSLTVVFLPLEVETRSNRIRPSIKISYELSAFRVRVGQLCQHSAKFSQRTVEFAADQRSAGIQDPVKRRPDLI